MVAVSVIISSFMLSPALMSSRMWWPVCWPIRGHMNCLDQSEASIHLCWFHTVQGHLGSLSLNFNKRFLQKYFLFLSHFKFRYLLIWSESVVHLPPYILFEEKFVKEIFIKNTQIWGWVVSWAMEDEFGKVQPNVANTLPSCHTKLARALNKRQCWKQ